MLSPPCRIKPFPLSEKLSPAGERPGKRDSSNPAAVSDCLPATTILLLIGSIDFQWIHYRQPVWEWGAGISRSNYVARGLTFLCCERRGREYHVRKSFQRKQSQGETLNAGSPWGCVFEPGTAIGHPADPDGTEPWVRAAGSARGQEGGSQAGTPANGACIRGSLASPAPLNRWLSSSLPSYARAPTAWQSWDAAAFCSHCLGCHSRRAMADPASSVL